MTAPQIDRNEQSERIDIAVTGNVGWLVISNPTKRNAISLHMWQALPEAIRTLDRDHAVRVIVLRGSGDAAFVAGADISEFETVRSDAHSARQYEATNLAAFDALRTTAKPTVAMIRGFCLGGGLALAMCCDLRVATASCQFGIPAARLGAGYPPESLSDLVALVGAARAKDILFTARRFDAAEAYRIGLIDRRVADDKLEDETAELCRLLCRNAPLTLQAAKAAINTIVSTENRENRDRILALTDACFDSQDYIEGRTAFLEKRLPEFSGA